MLIGLPSGRSAPLRGRSATRHTRQLRCRPLRADHQLGGELVSWAGTTEQVSLDLVAAEIGEVLELAEALDAFGDTGHAEGVGPVDDPADDGGIAGVRLKCRDEVQVDLDD